MRVIVTFLSSCLIIILLITLKFCCPKDDGLYLSLHAVNDKSFAQSYLPKRIIVPKNISIENYFAYTDSIVKQYDSITSYPLTEHILIRANFWIIDTLQNTDYYRMMAKDSFVSNQKDMIALPRGNSIMIPDSIQAKKILSAFEKTRIDINIPEFKLRIYEDSVLLYDFPIRVGRNEKRYLEMSQRLEDLRTKTGEGRIVSYVRNPRYVNPVNNHQYFVTKRDDDKVTKLPQIPFLETEINGLKYGQLIHPTTNPKTLGRAYSNGCIGTKEADAWVIYYYAPINTKVSIRYNRNVRDAKGHAVVLKDIYGLTQKQ